MSDKRQLLTHSRQDCFKVCRRKHWYAYELGLRRIEDGRALRIGKAMHEGIAALGDGEPIDFACQIVHSHYAMCPGHFDGYEWSIERETVLRLLCAYGWRWESSPVEFVVTEKPFQFPLVNPTTGKPTPVWDAAGVIDGIVKLEDGRLAVKETKTVSDDISDEADMWRRLRMDHQISLYIWAAREMGYQVDTVLYDVIRKPSIAPEAVPIVDDAGLKIVLDGDGERVRNITGKKEWRQTGDKEKNYTLQTRPMSADEWGEKLTNDICMRPDFYFARREIPRLDQDVNDYQAELWEIQQAIREAQRSGRWYRTVNRNSCGFCSYFDICSTNQPIDPSQPPEGFEIVESIHPELERANGRVSIATVNTTETAAACTAEAGAAFV